MGRRKSHDGYYSLGRRKEHDGDCSSNREKSMMGELLIGDGAQMGLVGGIPAQAKQRPVVIIPHIRGREGDLQPEQTLDPCSEVMYRGCTVSILPLNVLCPRCPQARKTHEP